MGAPRFLVYYGLRWGNVSDEELELLEKRMDPRQIAARDHSLDCWWGCRTDVDYFVLLGQQLGEFGWEGSQDATIADASLKEIVANTQARLFAAGYNEAPALHCQFEPDF